MRKKYVSLRTGAILGIVLLGMTFLFLAPDESYQEKELPFDFRGTQISGKLLLPLGPSGDVVDCMVFVHGDGAMPYDGMGYFVPYFSHFAQKGMCSFSWDKPGVNGTAGEWLDYSMADRAALVETAVKALRSNAIQPVGRVGLIGFSQAGWVLPKVEPTSNEVSFYVFVSPAVNWMEQSAYMTGLRAESAPIEIEEQRRNQAIDELILAGAPYAEFEQLAATTDQLNSDAFSPLRWGFVVKNAHSDLVDDLARLDETPVLLLTGARDGQVDAAKTNRVFDEVLGSNLKRSHFANAGHSMIEVEQTKPMDGFDGVWLLLKTGLQGRNAFVAGYWAAIDEFIAAATN